LEENLLVLRLITEKPKRMNFAKGAFSSVTSAVSEQKDEGLGSLKDKVMSLASGNAALKNQIAGLKEKLAGLIGGAGDSGKEASATASQEVENIEQMGEAELETKKKQLEEEKLNLTEEVDSLKAQIQEAGENKAKDALNAGQEKLKSKFGGFGF